MAGLEAHYSARDIEARILAAVRAAGLNPEQRLSPEALGALDHFHTGGFRASLELLELARIRAEDRVLDVGAGLAGSARLLASTLGCRVDCIELSPDYCAGAVLLNRLTGLDDRIEVHEGSALDLPFPDDSFDAVWMQNVGMNIADKRKLYAEISRVLRPGGRFAFQEMAAGEAATSYFPAAVGHRPCRQLSCLCRRDALGSRRERIRRRALRGHQRRSSGQESNERRAGTADAGGVRRQSRAEGRERAAQSRRGPGPARPRRLSGDMSRRTAGAHGTLPPIAAGLGDERAEMLKYDL